MPAPKPVQVRQARAFLGKKSKIKPNSFAQAANELGASFAQTMQVVRAMIAAGHGQVPPTQSPIAQQIAETQAAKGK